MNWLKQHLSKIVTTAVLIVGAWHIQDIEDWVKLLNYQAPARVARLATVTTMTETARRLFYVNKPTIETKKLALNLCKSSEHTVVLGCYVVGKGIFLQDVTDSRLQGVMEVTAAHEMLHVAYQRMSLFDDRQKLNQQLKAALHQLKNPRIQQLIETYTEQDSDSVLTELHSILGTEVRDLSPELEQYYRKYFTNRSKIVALSERYEGVFTTLRDKAKDLSQQLKARKSTMETLVDRVKTDSESIESDRLALQRSISIHPQADYQFQISILNDRVRSYNQLVSQLREQTEAYNQMVNEHNSLSLKEKSLVESLQNNTSSATAENPDRF
jgi:allophanate hydrolase subunit 1